jgi:4-diphosphocytidyl-2-C-methyl-D-erythritol kinase
MTEVQRRSAPAKVNLLLRVLAREEGGFHQLETLFQALELADEVEVRRGEAGKGPTLELAGVEPGALGPPEGNLAVRAVRFLAEAAGVPPDFGIRLVKRIPHGAGLGGGSSDAAAVLLAANGLLGAPLPHAGLATLGGRLGADVPFFVAESSLALGWGRGDRILPLPALPRAPVLLALPPWGIATPEAYAALARHRAGAQPPGSALFGPDQEPWEDWDTVARAAENAFEAALFPQYPELLRIRDALRTCGAGVTLLSGSGSAVFGVFPDLDPEAPLPGRIGEEVARRAAVEGLRLVATATRG